MLLSMLKRIRKPNNIVCVDHPVCICVLSTSLRADQDTYYYGYTVGCEGCRRSQTGGMGPRAHSDKCRERMDEILAQEEEPRWKKVQERRKEHGNVPGGSEDHE